MLGAHSVVRFLLFWLIYVVILTVAALPKGINTELAVFQERIPLSATNEQATRALGDADAATYARGGKEIAQHGRFSDPSYLVLWPPGFFMVHAAILWAVGPDGPVIASLLVITVAAWAVALTLLRYVCRQAFNPWPSFLLPLSFVLFPFFRQYFLRNGIVFSESLSAALWTAGMLVLVLGIARSKTWPAIIGGVLFAIAAYIRTTIDLVLLFATAIVALDFVLLTFYGARTRGEGWVSGMRRVWASTEFQALVLALVAFHTLTMPYRAYKITRHGTPMFSKADYYYKYLWKPPEEYTPAQKLILEGGGPIGCATSPPICSELAQDSAARGEFAHSYDFYKRLAVVGLLSQPVRWLAYRARHLPRYWFSAPGIAAPQSGSKLPGAVLGLAFVGAVVFLPLLRNRRLGRMLFTGMAMIYGGHFVIFLFLHYEVRYLYLLQSSALLFFLASLVAWRIGDPRAVTQSQAAAPSRP